MANEKSVTYSVRNMRPVVPTGKVAQKNPDRFLTVHGEFHALDAKGNPIAEPLSITQKVIDRDTALNPLFAIDIEAGTLTLPAGERGRKASVGIESDALSEMLNALRNPESVEEAASEPAAK